MNDSKTRLLLSQVVAKVTRLGGERPSAPMEWAVVQDLRPFGIRVEGTGLTEKQARRDVAGSRYLMAMLTSEARRINEECADPGVVMGAIREDEFDWRQTKDSRGIYVHTHPIHEYPGSGAWDRGACVSGEHSGCGVS